MTSIHLKHRLHSLGTAEFGVCLLFASPFAYCQMGGRGIACIDAACSRTPQRRIRPGGTVLVSLGTLVVRMVGALMLVAAAAGGVWFHAAWQRRNPGRPWPVFAVVSIGAAVIVSLGVVLRSWPVALTGIGLWIVARFFGRSWLKRA